MRSLSSPTPTPSFSQEHSSSNTWHSPVPYLFGGLAAMLGLIAFALLILACSYWRLSRYLDDEGGRDSDRQGGDGKQGGGDVNPPPNCFAEGFVVIMAGDEKPTFLATPVESKIAADSKKETDDVGSSGTEQGGDRKQEH